MHFFSVVAACLLCSSLAAAGPLPRDRLRKLQFRQAAPFKNTTSTADSVAATIEVVPISLTETSLSTATTTTSPGTELSPVSTATTLSPSGFANTTLPSAPSTTATGAGDVPAISFTSPTATAAGDGANAAQTAKQPLSSNLSGSVPSGSIVQGTGNFSRTTVVSANSNTDASADSQPTTGTQAFPFAESLTTTPDAISTTVEAPFTFSSDPVAPTTLSTNTTKAPVAITVSGVGAAVTVTPSFFSSATIPPTTTDAPTTTVNEAIIKFPTVITAAPTSFIPFASASAAVAKNHELANYFNNLFPTLTPDIPCAPNSVACIEGSLATCANGRFVLEECTADNFACYAIPLQRSDGVMVQCTSVEIAEEILGLPNSLSVTIGSVPVVVPTTTAKVVQSTSVTDPGPTTTAAEAAATVAAVQSSDSDDGEEEEAEEATTVLHTTLVSTITIAVSDFAPSTVVAAAEAATVVAAADGSLISVVPVAAAVGGSGNEEEEGKEGGPVTVTVTRSVTVTEQFTVTRAGVTATVTAGGRE